MAKSKKPAKPAKKATVAKAKPAKSKPAKAKPASKPAAKPAKKTTKKATTAAKPAKASAKPKKPTKPKKSNVTSNVVALMAHSPIGPVPVPITTSGGVPATPQITSPLANANVAAGTNLRVTMTTNQTGFRYILELLDITPPPPPLPPAPPIPVPVAVPVLFNIAAPGASPFSSTILGANLLATRNYRLRVSVDLLDGVTPPNLDHAIPINS